MSTAVVFAFVVGLCVGVISCAALIWSALVMAERLMSDHREEPLP